MGSEEYGGNHCNRQADSVERMAKQSRIATLLESQLNLLNRRSALSTAKEHWPIVTCLPSALAVALLCQ
jgi:hypothetical protein